jgi:hypothetical protein
MQVQEQLPYLPLHDRQNRPPPTRKSETLVDTSGVFRGGGRSGDRPSRSGKIFFVAGVRAVRQFLMGWLCDRPPPPPPFGLWLPGQTGRTDID